MRVLLIVDANELSRDIADVLEEGDHWVTFVRGLNDLSRAGHALDYNLLIVDLRFSGFDVLSFLESQCRFQQSRHAILYAADAETLLKALSLGYKADQCLAEPFVRADLVRKLANFENTMDVSFQNWRQPDEIPPRSSDPKGHKTR